MFNKTLSFPITRESASGNHIYVNSLINDCIFDHIPKDWLNFRSGHGMDFVTNDSLDSLARFLLSQLSWVAGNDIAGEGRQKIDVTITSRNASFTIYSEHGDDVFTLLFSHDCAITVIVESSKLGCESLHVQTNNGSEPLLNTAMITILQFLMKHDMIMN